MNLPTNNQEALPPVLFYNEEQHLEIESLRSVHSEKDLFGEEEEHAVLHRQGASKWRIRVTSERKHISVDLQFEYTSAAYPKSEGMPKYNLSRLSGRERYTAMVDMAGVAQQLEEIAGYYNRLVISTWVGTLQEILDDAEQKARAERKAEKKRKLKKKVPEVRDTEPDTDEKDAYLGDFFATFPKDPRPFVIFSIGKSRGKGGWFDANYPVINVRCINNKSANIDYRSERGYGDAIQQNVMRWSSPNCDFKSLFRTAVERIKKEGHKGVAFQCSKGRHRSVAMACILQKRVFVNAIVQHVELSSGAPRPKFEAAIRKAKKGGWKPQ